MFKRFVQYYRPHIRLLLLDMSVAILGALCKVFMPVITRRILNDYVPGQNTGLIYNSLAIMLGLITLTSVFGFIRIKWGHILGVRMEFDMRADFFGHIQKLSFRYFDNTKTGHIMSRISNDLNTIAEVAHHAPEDILISISLIIGAFIAMICFNWRLALVAFAPIPLLACWGVFYGGSMRRGFRKVRKRIADLNSSVENSVQGIREVKSFTNEDEEVHKFAQVNMDFRSSKEKMYHIMAVFFAGMSFLIEGYFFVVIVGGVWLISRNDVTVADLLAFVMYVYFILNPIRRLVNFAEQFQHGIACFERFVEVMDIEPDIVDSKDAYEFDPIKGRISLQDVTFRYGDSGDWVLQDVDIEIPSCAKIAIVGESGAGKTTIASLIPRFYEPQRGTITIDGHDIKNLKRKFLRRNIGIVQQNVFLFDSTIRENIMYGDLHADEQAMMEAARKANIYDFIQSLPDRFDTHIGERGVKLSGGQQQRISIARVFLKDPPIFIFDEATSSLDSESEALIQKSLELLSRDRTTIVIAHRLSTVRDADYLYVLKRGRVAEQGTHTELIEKKAYYHSLYTLNLF